MEKETVFGTQTLEYRRQNKMEYFFLISNVIVLGLKVGV
jgi:hypothetical protein